MRPLGVSLLCRAADGTTRIFSRECAVEKAEYDRVFLAMGGSYEGVTWETGDKYP